MPGEPLRSSEQPPAIGYIRVDEPKDGEVANHLREIAACCLYQSLRLVRSFCDQGYDGSQLARPGSVELRQALKETPGLAVVVPSLNHLAPAESIRGPLLLMVHRLGGRVLVANEPNGHTDDQGVIQHGVWVDVSDHAGERS